MSLNSVETGKQLAFASMGAVHCAFGLASLHLLARLTDSPPIIRVSSASDTPHLFLSTRRSNMPTSFFLKRKLSPNFSSVPHVMQPRSLRSVKDVRTLQNVVLPVRGPP